MTNPIGIDLLSKPFIDSGQRNFTDLDIENGQLRFAGLGLGVQRLVDAPIFNSMINAMSGKVDAGGAGNRISCE